jgi:hypothetical protein
LVINFFLNVRVSNSIKCKEEKKTKKKTGLNGTKKNRVKWDRDRGPHFSLQRLQHISVYTPPEYIRAPAGPARSCSAVPYRLAVQFKPELSFFTTKLPFVVSSLLLSS